MSNKWFDRFIEKSKDKHDNKYTYENVVYKNSKEDVLITCKIHGDFLQKPKTHLEGSGCPSCGKDKTLFNKSNVGLTGEEFYKNLPETHKQIFFILSDYDTYLIDLDFICKVHGHFRTKPKNFLKRKHGCIPCTENLNGHSRTEFIGLGKRNNEGNALLYVIKCFNREEVFYKIGITSRNLSQRYSKANLPYDYEIVHLSKQEAGLTWDLEKVILKLCKNFKYKPKQLFNGSNECFKYD